MIDHDFELRLRTDLRKLAEPASANVRARVIAIPDEASSPLDGRPGLLRFAPLAMAAAAALIIVLISAGLFLRPPDVGPSPLPTTPSAEPSASMLPDLPLPGFGPAPPGQYGWTSSDLGRDGLHHVLRDGSEISLMFSTFDCFPAPGNEDPVSVTIAGLNGLYLEPYEPPVTFGGPNGGETTGAYALPIGDQTLCVYLTWDPTTPPDQLEAGRKVVESIRGQSIGDYTIRITFTLPGGWDTG